MEITWPGITSAAGIDPAGAAAKITHASMLVVVCGTPTLPRRKIFTRTGGLLLTLPRLAQASRIAPAEPPVMIVGES